MAPDNAEIKCCNIVQVRSIKSHADPQLSATDNNKVPSEDSLLSVQRRRACELPASAMRHHIKNEFQERSTKESLDIKMKFDKFDNIVKVKIL